MLQISQNDLLLSKKKDKGKLWFGRYCPTSVNLVKKVAPGVKKFSMTHVEWRQMSKCQQGHLTVRHHQRVYQLVENFKRNFVWRAFRKIRPSSWSVWKLNEKRHWCILRRNFELVVTYGMFSILLSKVLSFCVSQKFPSGISPWFFPLNSAFENLLLFTIFYKTYVHLSCSKTSDF